MNYTYLWLNVRHFRQLRNWSQSELARQAGPKFGQADISRCERGLQPGHRDHVDQLALALGVSVDALLRKPRVVRHLEAARPVVVRE